SWPRLRPEQREAADRLHGEGHQTEGVHDLPPGWRDEAIPSPPRRGQTATADGEPAVPRGTEGEGIVARASYNVAHRTDTLRSVLGFSFRQRMASWLCRAGVGLVSAWKAWKTGSCRRRPSSTRPLAAAVWSTPPRSPSTARPSRSVRSPSGPTARWCWREPTG